MSLCTLSQHCSIRSCAEVHLFHNTCLQLTYEWLAEIRNATSPYEPALCYGVFICSDWVLTAAKCLQQYRNRVIKLFEPVDVSRLVYSDQCT